MKKLDVLAFRRPLKKEIGSGSVLKRYESGTLVYSLIFDPGHIIASEEFVYHLNK
jgi:hypothetical protein